MRNKIVFALVGSAVMTAALLLATASQATPTSVDLGITGNTVAGYTAAQQYQELPVVFTMKNHSTTTATEVAFSFTFTNATANGFTCPLISNHFNINTDGSFCEPGTLGHGKSTSAAIMVTPTISSGTVTVTACAEILDAYTDPVSSNNCKTVTIPIG